MPQDRNVEGRLLINRNIKWIMLFSGALTSTVFFAALAPNRALNMMFGEVLQGPLAEIIVRNWGVLVGTVGLMLIYGAFNAHARKLVLVVATASKLVFIGLVLTIGTVASPTPILLKLVLQS